MATAGSLDGRVALNTGSSGGIGQALARGLAAEGAGVALGFGAHAEPAERIAEEIVANGGRAVVIGADLRAPTAPEELVEAVEAALGPIDALVERRDRSGRVLRGRRHGALR